MLLVDSCHQRNCLKIEKKHAYISMVSGDQIADETQFT